MSTLFLTVEQSEPAGDPEQPSLRRYTCNVMISAVPDGFVSNVVSFTANVDTVLTDSEISNTLRQIAAQHASAAWSQTFTAADVRGGGV